MKPLPLLLTVLFVGATAATLNILAREGPVLQPISPTAGRLLDDGELRSLGSATEWINTQPLTAAGLRGKVVLIDFWTYTCINWRRSLPYVRAWADKYRDQGLVVIGVHSPEFGFEKDLANVRHAAQEQRVGYPIAVDNDMAIWRGFDNNYWPALYLVDAEGRVRYHHFGEGEYAEAERAIQELLTAAGSKTVTHDLVSVVGQGAEAPADWSSLSSQENYVGYGRTEGLVSPGGPARDVGRLYAAPDRLGLNTWALTGAWTMTRGAITLNHPNGKLVYRFHARDLHLVMGPAAKDHAVRFRVLIDGQAPGAAHGSDVDDGGYGTLDEQRMYQLIRQQKPIRDRLFEIEFLDAGAELFSFTFG
jgi:thiol-disulfide isomerase/thioredoxin